VQAFARKICCGISHEGLQWQAGEYVETTEMGPLNGKISGDTIRTYDSTTTTSGLTRGTMGAFRSNTVVWGDWSVVPRDALVTAQSTYRANWVGQPYQSLDHNSNWYVQSLMSSVGKSGHVRGAFAPGFGQ
jgi:hypothetical protein